jgi:hypothetical protein
VSGRIRYRIINHRLMLVGGAIINHLEKYE